MTPRRWQTLPPGYIAQPMGGGEHDGMKWELNRVYDSRGKLDHDLTYWEVSHFLDEDPAPRSVSFADLGRSGVSWAAFSGTAPPLAEVERWIALGHEPRPTG
jgi:hypothetical protein